MHSRNHGGAVLAMLALAATPGHAQMTGAMPSAGPASGVTTTAQPAQTASSPFQASAVNPSALPGELKRARSLERQGQHAQALDEVEAFLKSHPDDPSGRFLRGVIQADLGQTKEAIETFTLLTIDHPELDQPYNNLGVLYAQEGDLERARQWLEQAVQANPQSEVALENLGDVYVRLATRTYEKATAVNQKNRKIRTKLTLARNLANLAASPGEANPAEANPAPAGAQGTNNSTPPSANSR